MSQAGEFEASFTLKNRLLPGDQAPVLRFAQIFNRDQPVEQVRFDRLTAVILWNAGCAVCLPIVSEIAELGAVHGVPCYGVAVMVRDVERTAAAAGQGSPQAILALEERSANASGLARGTVTRHWLEASGMQGVPGAFLVDSTGVVVWAGYPDEIRDVLPAIIAGEWSIEDARQRWQAAISDREVAQLRVVREITDALIAGEIDTTLSLIKTSEQQLPSLAEDEEFAILKFEALASMPARVDAALAHYAATTARFPTNMRVHAMLGRAILQRMGRNDAALRIAAERLAKIEDGPIESVNDAALRVMCHLLEAEAEVRLGRAAEAMATIDRANARSKAADFPETVLSWATSEIERLRGEATCAARRER